MHHYQSLPPIKLPDCWLTIGAFDGVHLGHQALIGQMVRYAHESNVQAVVLTFTPHPAAVLRGLSGPYYLTDAIEKQVLIAELGVDTLITLEFTSEMASLSPASFMRKLVETIQLGTLFVGPGFALGRGRAGDIPALTEIGEKMGFQVVSAIPGLSDENMISSSQIRTLIRAANVQDANKLLGRSYSVSGKVVHGDGRGHGLGFPTANVAVPEDRLLPAPGVYACFVEYDHTVFKAVSNIGFRPTFEKFERQIRLETHILDMDQNLYGKTIKVSFDFFIRPEQRFSSVVELRAQIDQDILAAREKL